MSALNALFYIKLRISMPKKILLSIISMCFISLLFVDVGDFISERIIYVLWPLGHVTVFAFWTALLILYQPTINNASLIKQWCLLTLCCFGLGITIELIQPFFGRSRQLDDLFMNYIGVLLSLIIFTRHSIHWVVKAGYFVVLGYFLLPSITTAYDEVKIQFEYPKLASFDNEVALTRWKADQTLSLVRPMQLPDITTNMMKITFVKRKYSGVALRYFKGDWQHFSELTFDFYNPYEYALPVTLIITDKHYNKGKPNAKDRFDKVLQIEPGFHQINLPLDEIKQGVALREMDLDNIAGVDFYMYKIKTPIHIYLASLYLQ